MPVETAPVTLARTLSLTQAVLYGLGVTIGAGIYVLVGVAVGRSGMHAPLAFLGAALVMAFSAASFAELGTRMPVSASEAAYVQASLALLGLDLFVNRYGLATQAPSACVVSEPAPTRVWPLGSRDGTDLDRPRNDRRAARMSGTEPEKTGQRGQTRQDRS